MCDIAGGINVLTGIQSYDSTKAAMVKRIKKPAVYNKMTTILLKAADIAIEKKKQFTARRIPQLHTSNMSVLPILMLIV